jgi:chromosome partitioning protein
MGTVIAFGALKGGVGKSTLAINVACQLAADGARVELVDADDQGTAVAWSEKDADRGLMGLPVPVVALPATEQTDPHRWLDAVLARRDQVDMLVLDLPPQLGGVARAALAVADLLVVPVTASGVDIASTARVLELVREAREVRGDGRPRSLLVPSRVDRRTASGREVEAVLHDFGEPVGPAVGQRSAHVDAFGVHQWVGDFAPRSAAHVEITALAAVIRRNVQRGKAQTARS